jgi:hypothetical protein
MLQNIKKGINFTQSNYELSKKNNTLDRFRGDEISYRIAQIVPLNAQIALLMDKDLKYNEWVEYQSLRADIKAQVDLEILAFETNTNTSHGA